MKHFLLIRPSNIYGLDNYPPLGLIQIGTALEGIGCDVQVVCDNGTSEFDKKVLRLAENSLCIGITATTAEIKNAIRRKKYLLKRA